MNGTCNRFHCALDSVYGFSAHFERYLKICVGYLPKTADFEVGDGTDRCRPHANRHAHKSCLNQLPATPTNRSSLVEFRRSVDERYRLSLPHELIEPLTSSSDQCVLVKERPGSLSLWSNSKWRERLDDAVNVVKSKWKAGRLDSRLHDVQSLGRLLSTRHRDVPIAGRGRLVIPDGFRDFLGVEPGEDVLLVGAAVCVEIWKPDAWIAYLNDHMTDFGGLLDELSS